MGGDPVFSDRQIAIASKLAPTPAVANTTSATPPIPCGSELARESGRSACINIECAAPFASKPAPTLFRWCSSILCATQNPVGASLLAMKSPQFQHRTPHPHHQKTSLLQPPPTPYYQATHPCAFAYNYARIRPLVRLVPGFYCLPATAHQWSGLVARFTSRLYKLYQSGICLFLMVAVCMAPSGAPGLM